MKHITLNANPETFQPMNINFGLMPDVNNNDKLDGKKRKYLKGRDKKRIQAAESLNAFNEWIKRIKN